MRTGQETRREAGGKGGRGETGLFGSRQGHPGGPGRAEDVRALVRPGRQFPDDRQARPASAIRSGETREARAGAVRGRGRTRGRRKVGAGAAWGRARRGAPSQATETDSPGGAQGWTLAESEGSSSNLAPFPLGRAGTSCSGLVRWDVPAGCRSGRPAGGPPAQGHRSPGTIGLCSRRLGLRRPWDGGGGLSPARPLRWSGRCSPRWRGVTSPGTWLFL